MVNTVMALYDSLLISSSHASLHARIQKVLSEGSNSILKKFFFFSWRGERGSKYTKSGP